MTPPTGNGDELQTITQLLTRLEGGDRSAFDRLVALVYEELRTIAHRHRRRWTGDQTLETTALVHEAYLKLADRAGGVYTNRSHFLAVASRAMRQILIDYARSKRREKRWGGAEPVSLERLEDILEALPEMSAIESETVLALSQSLERLEAESERHCRVVECRFFGGMTIEETAQALDLSPATVKRAWAVALAWLRRDLVQTRAE
jgi:RNA polymerase sigma factor (TIGR02999 family)